jgi:hypothetical protein
MSIKDKFKRAWKKVVAAVAAAIVAVGAWLGIGDAESGGATVTDTFTWTPPTQFIDGTAIPAGAIQKYTIVWGACGGPWTGGSQDVTAPATTAQRVRPGEGYGNVGYKINATVGGVAGVYSAEGCKNVVAPAREPTNFSVQ